MAAETGESLTDAVVNARYERLERQRSRLGFPMNIRWRMLQSDVATLAGRDPRAPEDILGYDSNGLPE